MKIIKDIEYLNKFKRIIYFISKDKRGAAIKFEREVNKRITDLVNFPCRYRKSYYFDDERYRDMIYKGYTIVYRVDNDTITILDIFKWQDR